MILLLTVCPNVLLQLKEDRALAQQLWQENRLLIDELRSGLRLSARSWVGVVRFSNFEVQVRPKLAGDNIGLVTLLDYAADLGRLRSYRPYEVNSLAVGDDLRDQGETNTPTFRIAEMAISGT